MDSLNQQRADRWMQGYDAGASGKNPNKTQETDDYFQAGYVVGKGHRKDALVRVETHFGVKPRR